MADAFKVPPRDPETVLHDLEAVLAVAKKTSDPELLLRLLKEMKELIVEADGYILGNMLRKGPGTCRLG